MKRPIFLLFTLMFLALQLLSPTTVEAIAIQTITVSIIADNSQKNYSVQSGSTVSQALSAAKIELSALDKVSPPLTTVLTKNAVITVVRVREEFRSEESVLQFESQTIKNESMPDGETKLIQTGKNGLQKTEYKTTYEDNKQVSEEVNRTEIITAAIPEIILVGVKSNFSSLEIPGSIAYLTSGNAWLMERNTGNRIPIVTSGDLDGFIFDLSSDGKWLLFTRKLSGDLNELAPINELHVAGIAEGGINSFSLQVKNVIHHAAWVPGETRTISFSTVEPRATAPGWQANNDLNILTFSEDGKIVKNETVLSPNAGGLYGWWGTSFQWSADGQQMYYSRPDSIGKVDIQNKSQDVLAYFTPLETGGNWAWAPGISVSSAGDLCYFVLNQSQTGSGSSAHTYNLAALNGNGMQIPLVPMVGMFSYPSISPPDTFGRYQIAYLRANSLTDSQNSTYTIEVIEQDGSNLTMLYPKAVGDGVSPQKVVWGMGSRSAKRFIGFQAQGNLWIISMDDLVTHQITGDGSIVKLDWE